MSARALWVLVFCLAFALGCGDDAAAPDAGAPDVGMADASGDDAGAPDATGVDDGGPDAADASDGGPDVLMPTTAQERLGWRGPEVVGYRKFTVTYARPDGEGDREVELLAWYPGAVDEGPRPAYTLRPSTVARENVDAKPGAYPVLVFSHGHQAIPDAAAFVMEHFASHGWVVLSVEHAGNTLGAPDRTVATYYLRPHDLRAALDFALADPFLSPLMSTPRVLSGHSFGGYTAYATAGASYDVDMIRDGCGDGSLESPICTDLDEDALALFDAGFFDDRYDAVLAMASGDFRFFDDFSAITIPVMQMVAEDDGHPAGREADDEYWNALDGAMDMRFNLLGGGHNSFTDVCVTLPGFPGCTEQDGAIEVELVRLFALAFVRDRLMDDADARTVLMEGDALVELNTR